MVLSLLVITGDFYGIIHYINGVSSVLITGISGHKCTMCFKTVHTDKLVHRGRYNTISGDVR